MDLNNTIIQNYAPTIDVNTLLIRVLIAIVIIIIGIIIGKIVKKVLKKILDKINIKKNINSNFITFLLLVIELSIYIIFINISIKQLEISILTDFVNNILILIPAFTGSLVLIVMGFALSIYLRDVIKESEVTGGKIISITLFYFVFYIFMVYATLIALISVDKATTNAIIIILTSIVGVSIAYTIVKKELKNEN